MHPISPISNRTSAESPLPRPTTLEEASKGEEAKDTTAKGTECTSCGGRIGGSNTNDLGIEYGSQCYGILLESSRLQSTIPDRVGEPPVSTGLLLSPPDQHMGMRRAYSGGHTPTLASTVNAHPPPSSTTQTVVARTRRNRPPSAARDDASRPASRASGTSRPDSALSFHDADLDRPTASTSNARQEVADDRPPRSRTRVHLSSNDARITLSTRPGRGAISRCSSTRPRALQLQPHRHQCIARMYGTTSQKQIQTTFRRPSLKERHDLQHLHSTHSFEASNDAQLIGPQPHARIPDSPPPPFRQR